MFNKINVKESKDGLITISWGNEWKTKITINEQKVIVEVLSKDKSSKIEDYKKLVINSGILLEKWLELIKLSKQKGEKEITIKGLRIYTAKCSYSPERESQSMAWKVLTSLDYDCSDKTGDFIIKWK